MMFILSTKSYSLVLVLHAGREHGDSVKVTGIHVFKLMVSDRDNRNFLNRQPCNTLPDDKLSATPRWVLSTVPQSTHC